LLECLLLLRVDFERGGKYGQRYTDVVRSWWQWYRVVVVVVVLQQQQQQKEEEE